MIFQSLVKVSHATIIIQSGMDGYTLGIHVALGTMIGMGVYNPLFSVKVVLNLNS